jgi:uncharacterized repeat protein (TIGR03803 family)
MQSVFETWTMMPMNFDLTNCCSRMLAIVATLAIQMTLALPKAVLAQDDDDSAISSQAATPIPDTLIYSFGTFGKQTCGGMDGADPKGSLTSAGGLLFGRTSTTGAKGNGDGIIFHIDPVSLTYTIDHKFAGAQADGNNPRHNAMTLNAGVLYGTTLTGGQHNTGTIFSINDDGTGYSTPLLYSFDKGAKKNNGDMPHSCFAINNGVLYGMTSQGGTKNVPNGGDGTIFSFVPQTKTYTKLFNFDGTKHGSDPHGQPILDPNMTTLYGMTRAGGKHNVGIIFSFDLNAKTLSKLHDFTCPGTNSAPACINKNDGATPDHGTLVQSGTTLYGLTTNGGQFGFGTIFSFELTQKTFTVLHSFGPTTTHDGLSPFGSLMLNGTTLYGTTRAGGTFGNGTVFQISTDGTGYTRVHDFQGGTADGANPIDNVILLNIGNVNTLFGMTENGGRCNLGTIFSIALP